MELVFATQNSNKVKEIQEMMPEGISLINLSSIGLDDEIPEPFDTLQENALAKAEYVYKAIGKPCFADDTGLEVFALEMRPGVLSARYAGSGKNPEANMKKLLLELEGKEDRSAQFRTVVALVGPDGKQLFEGICKGTILHQKVGGKGFGYDPIFRPEGWEESFAEMDAQQKNQISHRGIAFRKLVGFLSKRN